MNEYRFRLLIQARFLFTFGPIVFQQNVITNRIHKSSQPISLSNATFSAQQAKHSDEGLLTHIFDRLVGAQSGAQLQPDEFTEIAHEMGFDSSITRSKFFDIGCVKREELHAPFPPIR
jgi:hypothetical protein